LAFGVLCASSQAAIYGFAAPVINGAQEVPPTSSQAYGSGSFTLDTVTYQVSGSVSLINLPLTSITGAHIHMAPAGANGPVAFNIMGNNIAGSPISAGNMTVFAFQGFLGAAFQNAATVNAMIAGDSYFNFHTGQFPGGAIRGQIDCTGPVPEPSSIAALATAGIMLVVRRRRAA
jgi:CHRD domain